MHTCTLVYFIGHSQVACFTARRLCNAGTRPLHTRYIGVLRDNRRGDFVTQRAHRGTRRADEQNTRLELREHLREAWVLRCMAPASPHSVHAGTLSNIDNQLDIGVIVSIGATGHFHVFVRHADVFSVHTQVFRRRHYDKLNGTLIAKRLVGPFAHGANLFHSCNTIVTNKHLGNYTVTTRDPHKLCHRPRAGHSQGLAAQEMGFHLGLRLCHPGSKKVEEKATLRIQCSSVRLYKTRNWDRSAKPRTKHLRHGTNNALRPKPCFIEKQGRCCKMPGIIAAAVSYPKRPLGVASCLAFIR